MVIRTIGEYAMSMQSDNTSPTQYVKRGRSTGKSTGKEESTH